MAIEDRVRSDIAGLGVLTGVQPSLAEVAYALAKRLDAITSSPGNWKTGTDPTAMIAKQLVEVMEKLAPGGENDALANAYAEFTAALSTPVRNAKNA